MATPYEALHPKPSDEQLALEARYKALPDDARRARAFEAFAKVGLPHRRVEGWRWSDVRASLRAAGEAGGALPVDPFAGVGEAALRFSNDGISDARPAGVRIEARKAAGALNSAEEMPLAALAVALADKPASYDVELSVNPAAPVRLVFSNTQNDQFRHVTVLLREGVEAHVIESHIASGGFCNVVVEYILEAGAVLHRTIYQAGSDQSVQAATATVRLARDARITQTSLAVGGGIARIETRVWHDAGHSHAEMNGAYLANASRHIDMTSHVRHSMPDCTTKQTVKGAVRDGGRGVFQGKFFVARDAQKTDAQMEHHALLLEDGAEVNAKPELEIYAADVQCAHGNTAGAIDEAALYYIRQRGVPEAEARAMLTETFLAEAFEAAEDGIADILMAEARRWLLVGA